MIQPKQYAPKELNTTKEIDQFFGRQRGMAYETLDELRYLRSKLPALLIAGKITGLDYIKGERNLDEQIRKAEARINMSRVGEAIAHKQKKREGSAWV